METSDTYLFTHEYLTGWSFNKDQFNELLVIFAVFLALKMDVKLLLSLHSPLFWAQHQKYVPWLMWMSNMATRRNRYCALNFF